MRQTRDHLVILLARLEAMGIDREKLVTLGQIDVARLQSSVREYFDDVTLLEAAAELSGDPLIAVRAHICWGTNYRSLYERYLRSLPNLREVLEATGHRIHEQFPDLARRVSVGDEQLRITYDCAGDESPISIEHYVMTATSFFVRAAGERARPSAIHFRHAERTERSAYEALFGCPVHFESDEHALVAHARILDLPLLQASPEVCEALRTLLGPVGPGEPTAATVGLERISRTLRRMLYTGDALTVEALADRLGISGRTLQRKLTAAGASFRSLRSDAMTSFAKKRLAESEQSVSDIAVELGFRTPTSFSRAFVSWVGESPTSFRTRYKDLVTPTEPEPDSAMPASDSID